MKTSDFNGDGQKGNSLLYIPTDEELDKMKFVGRYKQKGRSNHDCRRKPPSFQTVD